MPRSECNEDGDRGQRIASFWNCVLGFDKWKDYFDDHGVNVPQGLVFRWGEDSPQVPQEICPCPSSRSTSSYSASSTSCASELSIKPCRKKVPKCPPKQCPRESPVKSKPNKVSCCNKRKSHTTRERCVEKSSKEKPTGCFGTKEKRVPRRVCETPPSSCVSNEDIPSKEPFWCPDTMVAPRKSVLKSCYQEPRECPEPFYDANDSSRRMKTTKRNNTSQCSPPPCPPPTCPPPTCPPPPCPPPPCRPPPCKMSPCTAPPCKISPCKMSPCPPPPCPPPPCPPPPCPPPPCSPPPCKISPCKIYPCRMSRYESPCQSPCLSSYESMYQSPCQSPYQSPCQSPCETPCQSPCESPRESPCQMEMPPCIHECTHMVSEPVSTCRVYPQQCEAQSSSNCMVPCMVSQPCNNPRSNRRKHPDSYRIPSHKRDGAPWDGSVHCRRRTMVFSNVAPPRPTLPKCRDTYRVPTHKRDGGCSRRSNTAPCQPQPSCESLCSYTPVQSSSSCNVGPKMCRQPNVVVGPGRVCSNVSVYSCTSPRSSRPLVGSRKKFKNVQQVYRAATFIRKKSYPEDVKLLPSDVVDRLINEDVLSRHPEVIEKSSQRLKKKKDEEEESNESFSSEDFQHALQEYERKEKLERNERAKMKKKHRKSMKRGTNEQHIFKQESVERNQPVCVQPSPRQSDNPCRGPTYVAEGRCQHIPHCPKVELPPMVLRKDTRHCVRQEAIHHREKASRGNCSCCNNDLARQPIYYPLPCEEPKSKPPRGCCKKPNGKECAACNLRPGEGKPCKLRSRYRSTSSRSYSSAPSCREDYRSPSRQASICNDDCWYSSSDYEEVRDERRSSGVGKRRPHERRKRYGDDRREEKRREEENEEDGSLSSDSDDRRPRDGRETRRAQRSRHGDNKREEKSRKEETREERREDESRKKEKKTEKRSSKKPKDGIAFRRDRQSSEDDESPPYGDYYKRKKTTKKSERIPPSTRRGSGERKAETTDESSVVSLRSSVESKESEQSSDTETKSLESLGKKKTSTTKDLVKKKLKNNVRSSQTVISGDDEAKMITPLKRLSKERRANFVDEKTKRKKSKSRSSQTLIPKETKKKSKGKHMVSDQIKSNEHSNETKNEENKLLSNTEVAEMISNESLSKPMSLDQQVDAKTEKEESITLTHKELEEIKSKWLLEQTKPNNYVDEKTKKKVDNDEKDKNNDEKRILLNESVDHTRDFQSNSDKVYSKQKEDLETKKIQLTAFSTASVQTDGEQIEVLTRPRPIMSENRTVQTDEELFRVPIRITGTQTIEPVSSDDSSSGESCLCLPSHRTSLQDRISVPKPARYPTTEDDTYSRRSDSCTCMPSTEDIMRKTKTQMQRESFSRRAKNIDNGRDNYVDGSCMCNSSSEDIRCPPKTQIHRNSFNRRVMNTETDQEKYVDGCCICNSSSEDIPCPPKTQMQSNSLRQMANNSDCQQVVCSTALLGRTQATEEKSKFGRPIVAKMKQFVEEGPDALVTRNKYFKRKESTNQQKTKPKNLEDDEIGRELQELLHSLPDASTTSLTLSEETNSNHTPTTAERKRQSDLPGIVEGVDKTVTSRLRDAKSDKFQSPRNYDRDKRHVVKDGHKYNDIQQNKRYFGEGNKFQKKAEQNLPTKGGHLNDRSPVNRHLEDGANGPDHPGVRNKSLLESSRGAVKEISPTRESDKGSRKWLQSDRGVLTSSDRKQTYSVRGRKHNPQSTPRNRSTIASQPTPYHVQAQIYTVATTHGDLPNSNKDKTKNDGKPSGITSGVRSSSLEKKRIALRRRTQFTPPTNNLAPKRVAETNRIHLNTRNVVDQTLKFGLNPVKVFETRRREGECDNIGITVDENSSSSTLKAEPYPASTMTSMSSLGITDSLAPQHALKKENFSIKDLSHDIAALDEELRNLSRASCDKTFSEDSSTTTGRHRIIMKHEPPVVEKIQQRSFHVKDITIRECDLPEKHIREEEGSKFPSQSSIKEDVPTKDIKLTSWVNVGNHRDNVDYKSPPISIKSCVLPEKLFSENRLSTEVMKEHRSNIVANRSKAHQLSTIQVQEFKIKDCTLDEVVKDAPRTPCVQGQNAHADHRTIDEIFKNAPWSFCLQGHDVKIPHVQRSDRITLDEVKDAPWKSGLQSCLQGQDLTIPLIQSRDPLTLDKVVKDTPWPSSAHSGCNAGISLNNSNVLLLFETLSSYRLKQNLENNPAWSDHLEHMTESKKPSAMNSNPIQQSHGLMATARPAPNGTTEETSGSKRKYPFKAGASA